MAIIGALVTQGCTLALLFIGRFIIGTAASCMIQTFGKSIVENMPPNYSATFAMFVNASVALGFIPCYGMGAILPDAKDFEANKNDEMWRVIYLVPAFIGVFEIIFLLLVFKEEPITFCITNDREEEAIRHMSKVYRIKKSASTTEPIEKLLESKLGLQRMSTSMDASSTTFK